MSEPTQPPSTDDETEARRETAARHEVLTMYRREVAARREVLGMYRRAREVGTVPMALLDKPTTSIEEVAAPALLTA